MSGRHATVPPFNSCPKCMGSPGHNTRPHAQLPPNFTDMDAWMTSLFTERSFDSQATYVIDALGLFFHMGACTTRCFI